jgi:hypothetical protein
MKDIGVRLARQRLLRFRVPEPSSVRQRRWVWVGIVAWAVWALLLSDHSVIKLLRLRSDRDRLSMQLGEARTAYGDAKDFGPGAKLTDSEAERILRERHNYARPGELIYVIGEDTTRAQDR